MNLKLKIKGMSCNSCSQKIEDELKDKVNKIEVNFAKGQAEIDFNPEKISEKEIIETIKKLGYDGECEEKETASKEIKNISSKSNKVGWVVAIISVLMLAFILYYVTGFRIPDFKIPDIGQKASLLLLFAAGILTGFHCIAMCGGFVVSYTSKNALQGHKGFKQHLFYGGGKVLSYTIIGGIFGLIGGIFAFSVGLRGWIAILAGSFMIFYALGMFGIGFFKRFQFNPKFLTRFASSESSKFKGAYSRPLVTGLLNGLFIACGPLQAMYLFAAGTGNIFSGATSLMAFGLGTLPVMLGFGSLATVISHKATGRILRISAILVLVLGLIMLNRGLSLTGSSLSYDSIKASIIGVNGANSSSVVNGYQEVNMNMDTRGYHPNSFVIKNGIPVKWNIDVTELIPCNNEIIMNAYGIDVKLKQGLNVIEFTPTKTGTITFTCGMGMLRGSFIVTDTGTATQQEVQAATPTAGGSCSMGANGGGCGCGG